VLLMHCKFSCIVGDRSFSAAAVPVNFPVLLEPGVLVLLLHCKFSCIVGDRSFSAAAAL
jgi:hypothetical protein